jgi:uncharacterized phage protein (TIGR02220 family)
MSAEEVGAYIRLLCYQWGNGSIPPQQAVVDRIAGCQVSQMVLSKFPEGKNPRLETVRSKQQAFSETQRKKANMLWQSRGNAGASNGHMPNVCSPISDLHSPSPISNSDHSLSGKPDGAGVKKPRGLHPDTEAALDYLNKMAGRKFRRVAPNLSAVSARLSEPDVTLEGVKAMIDRQVARWSGTTQAEYLRPETLFNRTKFDSYYAAKDEPVIFQDSKGKPQISPIDRLLKGL